MNPALGPFAIAAALLVVGGALKALSPHDTAKAMRLMRLPANDSLVRVGGVVELALGIVALVAVDTVVAVLVAISYAAFCAFVTLALVRRTPIASCGCLGKVDTPPSLVHVGVNLGACIAAIGMAFDAAVSPLDVTAEPFPDGAAYVVLVAVGVLLAFAVLTVVPRAIATATRS